MSPRYRIMCLEAKELQSVWLPDMGDFMISKVSYCSEDDEHCSDESPCLDCMRMSNDFVISNTFNYSESVGGTHWYYHGQNCTRGNGNRMNSTKSSVMTNTRYTSVDIDYETRPKSEFLWLPRQDQLQSMIHLKQKVRTDIIEIFYTQIPILRDNKRESFESLWLKLYMLTRHLKTWDNKNFKWVE